MVLGRFLFRLLRLYRMPAEHGQSPGLGIFLLEFFFCRGLADLSDRVFSFFLFRNSGDYPENHENQTDHHRGYLRRADYNECCRPGAAGLELLMAVYVNH